MAGPSLLFDSNVFYAAIGISSDHLHKDAEIATRLMELAQKHDCPLYLAQATADDINRATDPKLRTASTLYMKQWKTLGDVPLTDEFLTSAGYEGELSESDKVDARILATLNANAADFLVTQDRRLRQHANQAGLGDRTLSITSAIELLQQLFETAPFDVPTLEELKGYQLDVRDPIFDSLKSDYPGFDEWFSKVQKEHRDCYVVRSPDGSQLDAIAILKIEEDRPYDLSGRVLKICTFKVADHATGAKRGELLLKAIFNYARSKDVESIYVEVLPIYDTLIGFLETFGFVDRGITKAPMPGQDPEVVLVKQLRPPTIPGTLAPLDVHKLYGPGSLLLRDVFVVPIRPVWHDILFPEARPSDQLPFAPLPAGNALIKAYLTRSAITKLTPGATLLFYRSQDAQAITAVGVVDDLFRSSDPNELRRFVGLRTVYTASEIEELTASGKESVLAIRFRHDRVLENPWPLDELITRRIVSAAPQTIQQVTDQGALTWIAGEVNARL
jgi:L-amino acid N-acyltransferase YncA